MYYHVGPLQYDFLRSLYSGGTAISATTIYSGSTDISTLLGGLSTYIQPGTNTTTGGTPSRPTVDVVASPTFSSLSATTIYSGDTNIQDLFASIGSVVGPQNRTIFVSKTGSNTNGSTPNDAFTTLSAATAYYLSQYGDASAVNPFSIVVLDTGSYVLPTVLDIPDYVAVNCSQSDIYGMVGLGDGSKLWVKNHYPKTSSDSPLVSKSSISTTSYYKADVMDTRGSGGTSASVIGVSTSGNTGQLFVDIKKLYATNIGIGAYYGISNGHIHLNIEDLYLARNGAIGVRSESESSIVGYIHHILEAGAFTNTLAFELAGGRVSIISTEIICDTFAYITVGAGSTSQIDVVCPYISVSTQYATDLGDHAQINLLTKNVISSTFPSRFMSELTVASLRGTSVSATTLFSGAVDLSRYLTGGTSTHVQPGVNTTTGGTSSHPTVDVVASPSFTSVSASTFFSGATDISDLIPAATHIQEGVNTTTGGTPSRPTINVSSTPSFTSVFATSISATTFVSGGTDLSVLFSGAPATYVQEGSNIITGGTPFRPTVNVSLTPSFTSVFATSVSATTFVSGGTNLSDMFGPATYVQEGENIITGGTPSRPIIGTSSMPVFSAVTAKFATFENTLDAGDINAVGIITSGGTDLSVLFSPSYVVPGTNTTTGGTPSRQRVDVVPSPSFTSVFATSISASTFVSGSTDVGALILSARTFVQNGTNTTTGGTPSRPTINVSLTPTFTSVFATSISASTLYSGASELSSLFLLSPTTGTTTVDFGFSSGGEGDFTSTTVSNSNVRVNSIILMNIIASDDHPETGEALLDEVYFMSGDIVDGTSFIINGYAERGTWGQYNVAYRIVN